MCLARFLNLGMDFGSFKNISITSAFTEVRKNTSYDSLAKRVAEQINSARPSAFSAVQASKQHLRIRSFFKTALPDEEKDINRFTKTTFEANLDKSVDTYKTVFNTSAVMKEINTDGKSASPRAGRSLDPEEGVFRNEDNKHLFERYHPPFGNSENPNYLNLVISDEHGNIKWLDLSSFIRNPPGEALSAQKNDKEQEKLLNSTKLRVPFVDVTTPYNEIKVGFMPERRMETEAGSAAISLLNIARMQKLPTLLDAKRCIQIKCVERAHRGRISNIRPIRSKPFGFITCGVDKFIRVWSQQGSMVGEINLLKEKTRLVEWKFGFNWHEKKQQEVEQA